MKQLQGISLILVPLAIIALCLIPSTTTYISDDTVYQPVVVPLGKPLEVKLKPTPLNEQVTEFLKSKDSPLSSHTTTLLEQEHWKLIVAISAIESSYCKRQRGYNCWGITDASGAYKSYASFDEAIVDANGLITRWQARGRWHSISDMDGHYVVPSNPNWVAVVTSVLSKLNTLSCHDYLDSNTLNQPEERCL